MLVIAQFVLLAGLSGLACVESAGLPSGILGVVTVSAADNSSDFQNTSPWFVSWWQKVKSEAGSMVQWFQNFAGSALNRKQITPQPQPPLTQYPVVNNTVPQSGAAQGGGGDMYGSNGSDRKPYVLEPNQFKKVCGKNEYVLWWSKRGSDGKDLKEVGDKEQNGWLVIPSCKELAKCHCCCNTCTKPTSTPCPPDVCFSKMSPCDSDPNCNTKCFCDKCKSECEQYKEPFHLKAFDRDCSCQQPGCPDGDGCKIVFSKNQHGWRWGQYIQAGGGYVLQQKTPKLARQAERESNDKITLFQTTSPDSAPGGEGWVDKLIQDKGKCCKCVSQQEADEGPQGSSKIPPETQAGGSPGQIGESPGQINTAADQFTEKQLTDKGFKKNNDGTYTDPNTGTQWKLGNDGLYHPVR